MVQIGELMKELQEKAERLSEKIGEMDDSLKNLECLAVKLGYPATECAYAILLIRNSNSTDSWEFLKFGKNMNILKDYLYEKDETELLRDLLEIEYLLGKLSTGEPPLA